MEHSKTAMQKQREAAPQGSARIQGVPGRWDQGLSQPSGVWCWYLWAHTWRLSSCWATENWNIPTARVGKESTPSPPINNNNKNALKGMLPRTGRGCRKKKQTGGLCFFVFWLPVSRYSLCYNQKESVGKEKMWFAETQSLYHKTSNTEKWVWNLNDI